MRLRKCLGLVVLLVAATGLLHARMAAEPSADTKKLDLLKYHNIGNIWLRVSNYGFFGSGDDITPQWPSLEYPGGSAIDYLYQGALWFGAKKVRRDAQSRTLYWRNWPPEDKDDVIAENSSPTWLDSISYYPVQSPKRVIDTLVTVGFDGDDDLMEFLPAYNPLEMEAIGGYAANNPQDQVITASIRTHRRGVDDDGDGQIDEDPAGFSFPLRASDELPVAFGDFGGGFLHNQAISSELNNVLAVDTNMEIWFPLGFLDLSYKDPTNTYLFSRPNDDDGDGLYDDDGYPVSEQDYISYYYDYSPFGTTGQRDWGRATDRSNNDHVPLNVRVRQMSYQWSFGYIKNLCYIEFDITNMNPNDTLFDCAMGIYMDSDVGPQAWSGDDRSLDDLSGFIGDQYQFAYTYDADQDNGLTTGYVGARVCTPDPEQLEFACWTWKRSDGPNDEDPLDTSPSNDTANEKYWLLTNKNPRSSNTYIDLKDENEVEGLEPQDTRYLFAFYGNQNGVEEPSDTLAWNLRPGRTMKIVIALFPGPTIEKLKDQAGWAKTIYGQSQSLSQVVEPDIFPHYNPPEPPPNPNSYIEPSADGSAIDVYWDNRSEFAYDVLTVSSAESGWRTDNTWAIDSAPINNTADVPEEFRPNNNPSDANFNINNQAVVNPWTTYRLRHDFQGYMLWGRSGSGSSEFWSMKGRWDKIETEQDWRDYDVARNIVTQNGPADINYGGYTGIERGLPNGVGINSADWKDEFNNYYVYNQFYALTRVDSLLDAMTADEKSAFKYYGSPIYAWDKDYNDVVDQANEIAAGVPAVSLSDTQKQRQALLFKHEGLSDEMFLALYDDKLIPLAGHTGQYVLSGTASEQEAQIYNLKKERLARRYYHAVISQPPRGLEYYVSVNAYDRGMPSKDLDYLESGKDQNMKVIFPGPRATNNMNNIYVVPNPYVGLSKFDGRREEDDKGDKSRRIWFVNLPEKCHIKITTLAGDIVDEFDHNGNEEVDIITLSKAAAQGIQASGMHSWDMLSKHDQIIASGVYLFSVKNRANGDIKVGKFVLIK